MPTDWRSLFTAIGVPWKDKGNNVARGRINIKCPFCADDPSEHLGIDEITGKYACWRNQNHWGNDPSRVLQKILRSRVRALALLEDYETVISTAKPFIVEKPNNGQWDKFFLASESAHCLDYLEERGFYDPVQISNQFNLRYTNIGDYSHRLLIPLYDANLSVQSWTGRALRDDAAIRYKTAPHPDADSLIATDPVHFALAQSTGNCSALLVEGPIDALKINAYKNTREIVAVGLTGLSAPEARLVTLTNLKPKHVFLCLDREAPLESTIKIVHHLRRDVSVGYVSLPDGYGDAGDMPHNEVNPWIKGILREARIT